MTSWEYNSLMENLHNALSDAYRYSKELTKSHIEINEKVNEALKLVSDMPEGANKRNLIEILNHIKSLLVQANGEHLK